MARLTINFSNKFKDVYNKVIKEENVSKVICEALRDYYDLNKGVSTEDVIERLDIILDRLDNGGVVLSSLSSNNNIEDVSDLVDCWED